MLLTAKTIAIFFGLAATAFCVSTIVLAVQKADLKDELEDIQDKLNQMSTATPTSPTATATPSTVSPSTASPPTNSPSTASPPTDDPSSPTLPHETTTPPFVWPTITIPTDSPAKPTLPPGLPDPEKVIYRLPTEIRPITYVLYWHPDLETRTFRGTVSIQIEVDVITNLIVLHCKDLIIVDGISILLMMARMRIRVKDFYIDDTREMLFIELEEVLYTSTPYVVSMSFEGKLDGLSGMYGSSYLDELGEDKWIATSKFEPTYARQAFPCFDEPAMKAQFEITVVRPNSGDYHVLSNMNIRSEEDLGDGNTAVHFEKSVPMSTYLACFILSDFAHESKMVHSSLPDSEDFEMRVFATKAQVNKVKYALETGAAITEYYINYFNIEYPLPKLDMAAIPDFVSGAMEHWGLVTYRETALLYDASISSSSNKQRVATVVAHELAHMWFGNLVTMKWWNDLWLNEGFASYIEYKGVNHVHPDWDMLDQFLIHDLHGVMKLDATLASHPIVQTVESPNQITELFDTITYSKGASLVRMLDHLVGEENFRNATTNYLFNFIYRNAETDDFLSELEALELNFDVKLIMKTWTEQMGLPVVEVTKNGNIYKLTQKRFFSNPEDYNGVYDDSSFNYRWSIPITYFTSENPTVQSHIFNYEDTEVSIAVPNAVSWIKFNRDQVGYYRVNYPAEMWQELIQVLKTARGSLSTSDRAHLISDVFALADAAQLNYSIAMDLLSYISKELNYVPWSVASSRINSIKNFLYYTDLYREFVVFGRGLVSDAYEEIGWNSSNDHLRELLRNIILNAACSMGHAGCLEQAAIRFNEWLSNPAVRPHPDIRSVIYYYGMQQAGNEKVWDQVFQLFIAEQDAQEKIKLMEALAAVQVPWILQRYINLAWNENNVRGQDYFTCLQYIASNRIGQSLVWDYVRENWPRLVERFGINERYLGRMIPAITSRFVTQTKLEEMEAFFAKYPEAGAGTAARKEALETVKYNIKWLRQNKEQLAEWLKANKEENESTTLAPNSKR